MKDDRKCLATRKVIFTTRLEAEAVIWTLKWLARKKDPQTGKRVKHRKGKMGQRRAYYCSYCKGYHLTSWKKSSYSNYSARKERETDQ